VSAERPAEPVYLDAAGVAERAGLKRKSIYEYLSKGQMPEPDKIWLRHPLWLVSTIDAWRAQRFKRGRKVARQRPKRAVTALDADTLWQRPPKIKGERRRAATSPAASEARAQGAPLVSGVSAQEAKRLAAAIREAGFHCTAADVHTLVVSPPGTLDHERELLRQRVLAKRRELQAERRAEAT
jgi:prophage regulatory protein